MLPKVYENKIYKKLQNSDLIFLDVQVENSDGPQYIHKSQTLYYNNSENIQERNDREMDNKYKLPLLAINNITQKIISNNIYRQIQRPKKQLNKNNQKSDDSSSYHLSDLYEKSDHGDISKNNIDKDKSLNLSKTVLNHSKNFEIENKVKLQDKNFSSLKNSFYSFNSKNNRKESHNNSLISNNDEHVGKKVIFTKTILEQNFPEIKDTDTNKNNKTEEEINLNKSLKYILRYPLNSSDSAQKLTIEDKIKENEIHRLNKIHFSDPNSLKLDLGTRYINAIFKINNEAFGKNKNLEDCNKSKIFINYRKENSVINNESNHSKNIKSKKFEENIDILNDNKTDRFKNQEEALIYKRKVSKQNTLDYDSIYFNDTENKSMIKNDNIEKSEIDSSVTTDRQVTYEYYTNLYSKKYSFKKSANNSPARKIKYSNAQEFKQLNKSNFYFNLIR